MPTLLLRMFLLKTDLYIHRNNLPWLLTVALAIGCLSACNTPNPQNAQSLPVSHNLWDALLQQHVDERGMVNYNAFLRDSAKLDEYLALLGNNAPNSAHWNVDEQLAYWMNAYNAFTVKLILMYYPLKSIKDIGPAVQVPYLNTPWQIKFIKIGQQLYSLDNIEHDIIRKKYDEPRIHFALVCAARSCPKLRNEAFVAAKLEAQLTTQTKSFLSEPTKNRFSEGKAEISKIFKWYKGDFTKKAPLTSFINQYLAQPIDPKASIRYTYYDWRLNSQ